SSRCSRFSRAWVGNTTGRSSPAVRLWPRAASSPLASIREPSGSPMWRPPMPQSLPEGRPERSWSRLRERGGAPSLHREQSRGGCRVASRPRGGAMRVRCALLGLVASAASAGTGDGGPHVAPVELRRAMPFVQVLVDGKGPYTFGIDTGTGTQALVAPTLAEKLGLETKGTVQAGDPSGKNPRQLPRGQLRTLSVAGVQSRGVTAAVYQPSQAEGPCDGILGFPLFKEWLLTLDYPGSRLSLSSGRLELSGDGSVVAFRTPD